jgi:hypothetical protein
MDFTSMVTNYNEAIMAADDRVSLENPPNPIVTAVEKYMGQTIVQRSKMKSGIPFEGLTEPSKMSELMCSCRITSRLIFIMILSGVDVPYGPKFSINSRFFEHAPRKIWSMLEFGVTQKQLEPIYFEFVPQHKLFLVQIFKKYPDTGDNFYSNEHSFVIYNEDGLCHVFSSWFDNKATPILYNKIPLHELMERLKLPNLLDDDNTNYLFGNNLRGELAILFFPCEVFDPLACKSLEKLKRIKKTNVKSKFRKSKFRKSKSGFKKSFKSRR